MAYYLEHCAFSFLLLAFVVHPRLWLLLLVARLSTFSIYRLNYCPQGNPARICSIYRGSLVRAAISREANTKVHFPSLISLIESWTFLPSKLWPGGSLDVDRTVQGVVPWGSLQFRLILKNPAYVGFDKMSFGTPFSLQQMKNSRSVLIFLNPLQGPDALSPLGLGFSLESLPQFVGC